MAKKHYLVIGLLIAAILGIAIFYGDSSRTINDDTNIPDIYT